MPNDDDFDITKHVLRLSKKIAQLTKDYVGLPFSNTVGQLPFSVDQRKNPQSKFYSTTQKWRRGDPLVGFITTPVGHKRMVLNLPDGSTLLDLCYPGWEIAVIDERALDHFYTRRYLFGDYYGHLLDGRPLHQSQKAARKPDPSRDEIENAMARQAELFQKRQVKVREAIEQQQRRGVPFDAQPEHNALQRSDSASQSTDAAQSAGSQDPKAVLKISVASHTVQENGMQSSRLWVQKTFSTGETETTDRSHQAKIPGDGINCDVEELFAHQLYNVFTGLADRVESAADNADSTGESRDSHV